MKIKIYSLLTLVMLMWGLNVSALKVLVDAVDPILLTSVRIFTAGVAVLIACRIMGIFRLPLRNEWLVIFYISIFNVILHHTLVAVGLEKTSGVNAGLILGLMPLVTVMMAVMILRQHVTWIRVFGFLLGFIGVAVTTLTGGEGVAAISIGDFIVFLGVIVQGFSFILISKLKPTFDPRLATGYLLVLGSFFIFLTSLAFGSNLREITYLFDWKIGAVFLFSAILATSFGHMTYNYAIKKVGPAESAVFTNLNTLFAITGAAVFLGEVITINHMIGFLLILSGVFIGTGALEYALKKRGEANNF
ncbi:DMT family transporter [Tenuibacillus multivorans]|uniref:Permease of the drug/metabolite transporter (DMT) superfamily n=1 Tax=Tenuibacillus multivorans TaxID=237069 RepID=A0A1H0BWS5_9BACI|nr:DMT family transporter [Tenuibacillus multivorans]GEL78550.1 membrane protein [Tenuibacillus multivorans]SDN50033.1 Permease of the drug/metabolite transporter (DMT) superfamily [Tenuibacillus multivorans]